MKAIVSGAGIAGLTVAGQLAKAGWDVVLVEAAAGRREQGYMIDFFGPGYAASDRLGILGRLKELAYPIERADFVSPKGRAHSIDYAIVAANEGGRLLSLMRQDVELALFEALPESVEVRFGTTVTGADDAGDHAEAQFADGSRESCDVLIGADGIHSAVRASVLGPPAQFERQLGMHTCAFTFESPRLHAKLGATMQSTDVVDRMVGLYGLRDGTVAMFGAHRVDDPALPDDPRAAIQSAYAGLGADVDEALEQCPDSGRVYYDQVAQIELPKWSSGRVVLAGDACQAVSLLAGQGASLAIAGGELLAQKLAPCVDGDDITAAFTEYQSEWMPVVTHRQAAGRRAASSFLPHTRLALTVRKIALDVMRWPIVGSLVGSSITGSKVSSA